jgi:hypothetical protein
VPPSRWPLTIAAIDSTIASSVEIGQRLGLGRLGCGELERGLDSGDHPPLPLGLRSAGGPDRVL